MGVYIGLIIFETLLSFLAIIFQRKHKYFKGLFLVLAILPFIIIVSIKNVQVGIDTPAYYDNFLSMNKLTISREFLFTFLTFCIRKITSNFAFYLIIMYSISSIAMFFFCYYSVDKSNLLFTLILNFGYLNLSLSGLRQSLSIPFFCLSILLLIKLPKYKKLYALIPAVISILFHNSSAILFFFVIPFILVRKKDFFIKACLLTVMFCLLAPYFYQLFYYNFKGIISNIEFYYPDASNTIKTFILFVLMFIYCFLSTEQTFLCYLNNRIPKIGKWFYAEISAETEQRYLLLSLILPILIIAAIGQSAIIFSRLIVTYVPLFLMSFLTLVEYNDGKLKNINYICVMLGSFIYCLFAFLINGGLGIVPYFL